MSTRVPLTSFTGGMKIKNQVSCEEMLRNEDGHVCRCYRYKDHKEEHRCALALCGKVWL